MGNEKPQSEPLTMETQTIPPAAEQTLVDIEVPKKPDTVPAPTPIEDADDAGAADSKG